MDATLRNLARDESGIALVIAVLLLLMVSAMGISALNRAGDERVVAVASRRQVTNLNAADAGLRLVEVQLEDLALHGLTPKTLTIDEPTLVKDSLGRSTAVRTGVIGNPAVQSVTYLGEVYPANSGNEIGIGSQHLLRTFGYRVDVTATDPSGGNTQVQAQYLVVTHGGY